MEYTNEIARSDYLHIKEMEYSNSKKILDNLSILVNAIAQNETYNFKNIRLEHTFNNTDCLASFEYESDVKNIVCNCIIDINDRAIRILHTVNLEDNNNYRSMFRHKSIDIEHSYTRNSRYKSVLNAQGYCNTVIINKAGPELFNIAAPIILELKTALTDVIIGVDTILLKCFSPLFNVVYSSIVYPSYRRANSENDKIETNYLRDFNMPKERAFSNLRREDIIRDVGTFSLSNNIAMKGVNIKDIIIRINNNTINMLIATGKIDYTLSDVILQLKDNKIILSHKYKPHYFAVNGVYEDKEQTSKVIAHLTDDKVIPINEWEDGYSGSIVVHMTEYEHERRKLIDSVIR